MLITRAKEHAANGKVSPVNKGRDFTWKSVMDRNTQHRSESAFLGEKE